MRNYGKAEVVDILREAHEAVAEAGVPKDLRVPAFNGALQLCSMKTEQRQVPILATPAPNVKH